MRSPVTAILFATCASLCAQPAPPVYTVTNLGVLQTTPGLTVSQATGINNDGVVIGYSSTEAFPMFSGTFNSLHTSRGWTYAGGAMTDLDAADSDQLILPLAINDSNLITVLRGPETGSSAYLLQNGTYTQPSKFPGSSLPFGLNDLGEISGTTFISSLPVAFTWSPNTEVKLPVGNGVQSALAYGVSANGIVAGALAGGATDVFGVSWAGGAAPILYTGVDNSLGESLMMSINSAGTGAGLIFNGGLTTEAAIFSSGSATGIGGYPGAVGSMATSINESGTVVGFSVQAGIDSSKVYLSYFDPVALLPPTDAHAFVYINGYMYDLTGTINDAHWIFSYASAVNNSGQIVGTGFYNGVQTAFLLTPQGGANVPRVGAAVGAGLSTPSVTTLSPGGLFAIFGTNLTSSNTPVSAGSSNLVDGALPTNLGGTCVEVNGVDAPLLYISAGQINAEGPALDTTGFVDVTVVANCGTSNELISVPYSVSFAAQSPEFLYWASSQAIAIEYPSYADVGSAGLIPGVTTAPATPGDTLIMYAVGLGATTPAVTPGVLAPGTADLSGQMSVTIGGVAAQILYAGVAPSFSGLYQINLTVPAVGGIPAGGISLEPIIVTVNGTPSPSTGLIAITN